MKLSTLLAFVGALPFPVRSARATDWRKPLMTIYLTLYESRRRQAARNLGRHQYLLDRFARPAAQPSGQIDEASSS
jgi:hypothetical protein